MSAQRRTRVAVAQLDYQPAIVLDRRSALTDPVFALGQPDGLTPPDGSMPPSLKTARNELRTRVRAAYVEQLGGKLRTLIATCRAWGVRLLVLPEYCVPWELLPELAHAADDMTIVAGTHSVERAGRAADVYRSLGWPDTPKSGEAVAPVLYRGQLLALTSKLNPAKPERRGLRPGTRWAPVAFDPITGPRLDGPMGVLICLDFLFREGEPHRKLVAPHLDDARFLAVPSFTPSFSTGEFGAKGWEEAKRYGRPVLYANHASGGGTTLFVDEGQPGELSRFPDRVGRLAAGEEGVIVADVDLGYARPGGSTRYSGGVVVVPVAAASLVYRTHPVAERYAEWSADMANKIAADGAEFDALADHVEVSEELLIEASGLSNADIRRRRLHGLLADFDGLTHVEELAQFTREVVMPPEVLPMGVVRSALSLGAAQVVERWSIEHRGVGFAAVEKRLREAARGVVEIDRAEWTDAVLSVVGSVERRVAGPEPGAKGRRKGDAAVQTRPAFPADARLGRQDKEVGAWSLMFRDRPGELVERARELNEPEQFVDRRGRRKPKRARVMHANFAPRQIELATELWLSLRAQAKADVSVVGIVGEDSAVVVLHCEDGKRVATAAGWGIGSAWAQDNAAALHAALEGALDGVEPIVFVGEQEHAEHLAVLRHGLSGRARAAIANAVALRVGSRGFVQPNVSSDGEIVNGFDMLDRWLDESLPAALLLGSFGMGKSTLLAMWTQAVSAMGDRPMPILVDLARATARDPVALICEALDLSPENDAARAAVGLLLRGRRTVICFDGFDEMATRLSFSDLTRELQALLSVARDGGKVLVSSRDHYFAREQMTTDVVGAAVSGAGLSGVRRIDLEDFGEAQVAALVREVITGPQEQRAVLDKIRDTYDLTDLVRTPLLLRMVLETIDQIDPGARVGSATIYEEYLERWLAHTQAGERELFTSEQKQAFAEALAAELWRSGDASISWLDLHRAVNRRLGEELAGFPADAPLEAVYLELQGGSFFVREGEDRFRFAHKSFLEFFLARALLAGFERDPGRVLDTKPITREVSAFVAQLVRDFGGAKHPGVVALCKWLVSGRGELHGSAVAAANALRVLRDVPRELEVAQDWVPERADLREIEFRREKLSKVRLVEAQFDRALLEATDFKQADLRRASLERAALDGARLWETRLEGCSLVNARLDGTQAHDCVLAGADFGGASLRQATWTGCDWSKANGAGVSVGPSLVQNEGDLRPLTLVGEVCLLEGHQYGVNSVGWSPDGRRLATAADDKSVRVWDAYSGTLLVTLQGHEETVWSVAWSPDGRSVASASDDSSVRVWDADDAALLVTLRGHRYGVNSVVWSPDGRLLASGSDDKSVRIWDGADGTLLVTLQGHESGVKSVAWSPDGKRLASASEDKLVRVWDAADGTLLVTLQSPQSGVKSVAWSPDGKRLASASAGESVRVWDADNGALLFTLQADDQTVWSVVWSPDGRRIASASNDKFVRVWDATDGSQLLALRGHQGTVWSVAWSPDGRRIASAAGDRSVRVWSVDSGNQLLALQGHEYGVNSVGWSPDGHQLASASYDRSLRVWDTRDGRQLLILQGHERGVHSVVWSPDGQHLASAADDHSVRVWNAEDGAQLLMLQGHRYGVNSVVWSPDGRWLASASDDTFVRVWDVRRGSQRLTLQGHEETVWSVEWSPDGRRLASASDDMTIRVWDANDASQLLTLEGHRGTVRSVGWSPSGRRLASASDDTFIRVWDANDGSQLLTLQGHEQTVMSVVWSPDGRWLASASSDRSVRVWDADSGTLLLTLQGHEYGVNSVEWSPDGRRLASASGDNSVRLWDVRETDDGSIEADQLVRLTAVGTTAMAALPSGHYRCTPPRPPEASISVTPTTNSPTAAATFYLPTAGIPEHPELIRDVLTGKRRPPKTHLFEDLGFGTPTPWDGRVTTIDLQPTRLAPKPTTLTVEPNPFAPGPALEGTSPPFGRDQAVTRLRDATRNHGSVVVLGQRRAGKTSLLNFIRHSTTDRLLLTLSLQDTTPAPRTPAELARALAPALANAPHPPANVPDLTTVDDPATALHTLLAAAPRPLLLIDEIGYLTAADSDLLSWLRGLGQGHAAMVYFGSRRDWDRVLSRAAKVGSSFGNDTPRIELGPFSPEQARRFLVETSPKDAKIDDEPLARWVVERCEGWPFYLQALGYALVESHREQRPILEKAALTRLYRRALLRDWRTAFESLWDDIPPRAQKTIKHHIERMRADKRATFPKYREVDPKERPYLERQGLLDPDDGWLLDKPLQDWLRELSPLLIHEQSGEGED